MKSTDKLAPPRPIDTIQLNNILGASAQNSRGSLNKTMTKDKTNDSLFLIGSTPLQNTQSSIVINQGTSSMTQLKGIPKTVKSTTSSSNSLKKLTNTGQTGSDPYGSVKKSQLAPTNSSQSYDRHQNKDLMKLVLPTGQQ